MESEQQKAIRQCKFFASQAKKYDELLHQVEMQITKLQGDKITYHRELNKYNLKLRKMVIEI